MPQYDLAFAEKLAQVASLALTDGPNELEAQRTVLHLSLLSTEIALKAMLEKAGKQVPEIRSRSHDLASLLRDLDQCKVFEEVTPGVKHRVPASRIRAITLYYGEAETTLGAVIETSAREASDYPNQVRYGDQLCHYPPAMMAQLATKVVAFAKKHWSELKVQQRL
jgi:hypothetical protein